MHTILGINGSTGKAIAEELNKRGLSVRGVSRRPFAGAWEHVAADVLDADSLKKAIAGSSVVYSCVGFEYTTKIWQRDWVAYIDNLIAVCRSVNAKLVFIDNVYMYGLVEGVMTENTPINPNSEKGKVRAEVAAHLLAAFTTGLKGCIARSADFYGPDNDKSFITTIFSNFQKGSTPQYLGNPDKLHSFTYIPDIGKACVTLGIDSRADGQVWHLPTANPTFTGRQLVEMGAKHYGVKPKLMSIGTFGVKLLGLFIPILREMPEMLYQFNNDYIFSSEKYEKTFGDVLPTPYEVGIAETARFYAKK